MKWIKISIISIILVFVISLLVFDRKINIAINNTTDKEVIKVKLDVEKNKPMNTEIGYSMFPMNSYDFEGKLGFQTIHINCPDLGLSKQIRIFTLYKNDVHFEFTTDTDGKYILIDRNSWFGLMYQ
jgi:hypothetical protein